MRSAALLATRLHRDIGALISASSALRVRRHLPQTSTAATSGRMKRAFTLLVAEAAVAKDAGRAPTERGAARVRGTPRPPGHNAFRDSFFMRGSDSTARVCAASCHPPIPELLQNARPSRHDSFRAILRVGVPP